MQEITFFATLISGAFFCNRKTKTREPNEYTREESCTNLQIEKENWLAQIIRLDWVMKERLLNE